MIGDIKTYERVEYTYEGQSECFEQAKVSEIDSVSYPCRGLLGRWARNNLGPWELQKADKAPFLLEAP